MGDRLDAVDQQREAVYTSSTTEFQVRFDSLTSPFCDVAWPCCSVVGILVAALEAEVRDAAAVSGAPVQLHFSGVSRAPPAFRLEGLAGILPVLEQHDDTPDGNLGHGEHCQEPPDTVGPSWVRHGVVVRDRLVLDQPVDEQEPEDAWR